MHYSKLDNDELLTTTRAVRKRLDLEKPVPVELIHECIAIALQAPTGGNTQVALIPTAWYTGDSFRPALRRSVAEVVHENTWPAP